MLLVMMEDPRTKEVYGKMMNAKWMLSQVHLFTFEQSY